MTKVIIEIIAFLVSTSGWVLMSATLPADYWKVSSNDASIGAVITTASFWRNLWKVCLIDSTGVTNCRDFPSLLELDGYIQVCRALMIAAVCLGFFAIACALVGMKCTKIGGNDQVKARIVCASGIQYFICGICSLTAFSLYANRTMNDFFDPMFMDIKYEIGSALFIGWAGAIMCILGGIVFSLSLFDIFSKRSTP
ncbi:claudin-10-like, partial [Neoarius graeffei]|uniref:claudin-10-like n=1 Tax=Neoarius graeffei TaxID=443677 RepID=UPI00298CEFF1